MDGQRNARRMRLSIQEIQQENTIHPIRGPIELRPVQARIGSSPGARTPARQRRGVTNRRGARGKESRLLRKSPRQIYPVRWMQIGWMLCTHGVDGK